MGAKVSRTVYIGVDPGKKGAVAYIHACDGGSVLSVGARYTPTLTDVKKFARAKTKAGRPRVSRKVRYDILGMRQLLRNIKSRAKAGDKLIFCIERQWPRPEDGKGQVQAMAEGYATWKTIATLELLPIVEISPAAWKPRYVPTGSDKAASVRVCRQIFPQLALPLVKDADRAEAVFIADYVRRKTGNLPFVREVEKCLVRSDGERPTAKKKRRRGVTSYLLRSAQKRR